MAIIIISLTVFLWLFSAATAYHGLLLVIKHEFSTIALFKTTKKLNSTGAEPLCRTYSSLAVDDRPSTNNSEANFQDMVADILTHSQRGFWRRIDCEYGNGIISSRRSNRPHRPRPQQ
jgi:hypothetical protein